MSQDRFFTNLQAGKTPEESIARLVEAVVSLTQQLNQANIPIVVGPIDSLPVNPNVGQTVIDWSTGISTIKTWNGNSFI
jgi:hypothetical protein